MPEGVTPVFDFLAEPVVKSIDESASELKPETKAEPKGLKEEPKKSPPKSNSLPESKVAAPKVPTKPESLDLEQYSSAKELEALGLDRLKSACMALRIKCG